MPRQERQCLALRGPVAADEDAVRGVGGTPRRIVGGDRQARVVEPDPAGEMHAGLCPPPLTRLCVERHGGRVVEHEFRARRARLDPPAGPGGQDEPGHIGEEREPLDQAVDLRSGHLDRAPALELFEPARRDSASVAVVDGLEPRDAIGKDHEPGPEDRLRLAEVLALASPHEHAAEGGLRRPRQGVVIAVVPALHRPEIIVIGLEHEGELPGLAAVPRHRHDPLGVAAGFRLHHEPPGFAEHREMGGRRPRADHDPNDRPPLDRIRQPVAACNRRPDELLDDQPFLGVELIELDLFGAEDDRPWSAGGVAGDVELHAGRHQDRGSRLRRCPEVEKEHQRPTGPALVGDREAMGADGGFHEPPPLLEFRRPGREPLATAADRRRGRPGRHGRGGSITGLIAVVRLVGHVVIGRSDFRDIVGHDVERDRRLVVDAREEAAAIDLEQHGGEHGAGKAGTAGGRGAAGLEGHAAAAMGRQLQLHFVFVAVVPEDGGPHLADSRAGDGGGGDRAGLGDVGRGKEMKEALLEGLHAAGSEGRKTRCGEPDPRGAPRAQHVVVPRRSRVWRGRASWAPRTAAISPPSPSPRVPARSRPACAAGCRGRG